MAALYHTEPYVLPASDDELAVLNRDLVLYGLVNHDLGMLDVPPRSAYFSGIFAEVGLIPRVPFNAPYELLRCLVARNQGYGLLINQRAVHVS